MTASDPTAGDTGQAQAAAVREVIDAEHRRWKAMLDADWDALASLLSDRLHFMHSNARSDGKASLLDKLRRGAIVYHRITGEDIAVTAFDGVATMTMRFTTDVSVGGARRTVDNKTLSVWVWEGGAWRFFAYQPTPIPAA